MIEDFEVEIVVHNLHIIRRMMEKELVYGGRASISQLVTKMGYGFGCGKPDRSTKESEIRNLIGLRTLPTDNNGVWKPMVLEMAQALDTKPDMLFPGPLKTRAPLRTWMVLTGKVGESLDLKIMD